MSIKVNDTYDWIDGRRLKVLGTPAAIPGPYMLEDAFGRTVYASGHEIIKLGFPTKIQIGQLWSHNFLRMVIEIVDILPPVGGRNRWSVREDEQPQQTPTSSDEQYIMTTYTLVAGLDLDFSHGPHRCPRCGSGGALVLLNLVACANSKCPCYSTKSVHVP